MSTVPKVSVLIPTYNYAHYLDETIQSVLNQTFTDFELVIVDNCSTDNTDEVIKKYLTDSRVVYHKNETNIGLIGNWNKCLEFARATYIKFLCADDKFHPQLLEKYVGVMDHYPSVSIVGSYYEIFGQKNFCRIPPFKGLVSGQIVREDLLGIRNRLSNPSVVMFRKADAMKIGNFNSQLMVLTDREYYFKLLTLGDCYIMPESLCYVRDHADTQSHAMKKNTLTSYLKGTGLG
jgi:glycosyltransferase involved in cell wall biosynthesis